MQRFEFSSQNFEF